MRLYFETCSTTISGNLYFDYSRFKRQNQLSIGNIISYNIRAEIASIYSKCHLIVLIYDTVCLVNLEISFQDNVLLADRSSHGCVL
jgi:hypothetical protein